MTAAPSKQPRSRIHALVVRVGILSAFVMAGGLSLASFALFGCYCWNGYTPDLQPIDASAEKPPPVEAAPPLAVP